MHAKGLLVVLSHLQLWLLVRWRNAGTFLRMCVCVWDWTSSLTMCVCVHMCICALSVFMCVSENVLAVETSVQCVCVFWLQDGTYGSVHCAALEIHEDLSFSISCLINIIPTRTQESGAGRFSLFPSFRSFMPLFHVHLLCNTLAFLLSFSPSFALSTSQSSPSRCPPPSSVYCNHNHQKPFCPVILSTGEGECICG